MQKEHDKEITEFINTLNKKLDNIDITLNKLNIQYKIVSSYLE
jgi:hypothetical protein